MDKNLLKRKYLFMMIPILILAFVLRVYSLSSQDLYYDETVFYLYSKEFVEKGTDPWTLAALQPPLPTWIYSIPMKLFGFSPFAVRFSSAFFGTLTILAAFYLGRLLYDARLGFWNAFLLAVSPIAVVYNRTSFTDTTQAFFLLSAITLNEFCIKKAKKRRF